MAQLANKTGWVEVDEFGTRRLVVEGQPVPPGVALEDVATGDDVEVRSLSRPVVDEEASKSYAERTGAEPPVAATSLDNADSMRTAKRSGGGSKAKATGSGSES